MATPNPTTSYFDQLTALQRDQAPPTYADISERARELSMLMPQQRKANIYDLATSLSQGLTQQAASGRPSSVGYGLAAGFNLFSEAAQKRRAVADEMQSKLMQMAYSDLEKRKADSQLMQEKMLDSNFKYELEMLKQNNGYFQGKSVESAALNMIIEGEKNPELKKTTEYKVALALITKPRPSTIQTERGTESIMLPGLNLDDVLNNSSSAPAATVNAPAGSTFTGQYKDGKPIFKDNDPNATTIYFTE